MTSENDGGPFTLQRLQCFSRERDFTDLIDVLEKLLVISNAAAAFGLVKGFRESAVYQSKASTAADTEWAKSL